MTTQSSALNEWAGFIDQVIEASGVSCEIEFPSGETRRFGPGEPRFRLVFHSTRVLKRSFDELSLGQAYVNGEFDIHGDMMSLLDLRAHLKDKVVLPILAKFWFQFIFRSPTWINRKSIPAHYHFSDDFFLSFIDKKYRIYSHCLFHSDNESLEQAVEHKFETMYEELELEPGMRLLDIGCGWGGVMEYCGSRGVHVTGVTLAENSYNYCTNLIRTNNFNSCEIYLEDFLNHRPKKPYDAIVIYGVIEHIPYYRRFFERVWDCLRPGGLLYLDASASMEKYDVSDFARRYIWHGTHAFMCLQDLIQELLFHGLELVRVNQETHDYVLTMSHWAKRFEANQEEIIERWGEQVYRAFRLYLWGGCHDMRSNNLQAYHLVARRRNDPGPRPGLMRRVKHMIQGLA